jgi:hypothetical protein
MNGWPPSITCAVDLRILFILQVVVAACMEISIGAECMCDAEWYATCLTGVARTSCLPRAKTSYDELRSGVWLAVLTCAQIWEFVAIWVFIGLLNPNSAIWTCGNQLGLTLQCAYIGESRQSHGIFGCGILVDYLFVFADRLCSFECRCITLEIKSLLLVFVLWNYRWIT